MIEIIVSIIIILAASIVIFGLVMTFSPKLQGKMMSKQVKSMRHMLEESKDDLVELSGTAAGLKKQILTENEEVLTDAARAEARIQSVGIKSAARAIKEGLIESDSIYCKHCGSQIDNDSRFCKSCGKEQ